MNKILIAAIVLVVLFAAGFFALNSFMYKEKQVPTAASYKDAGYVIDGKRVTLTNGVSEMEAAPGSASKIITRYFGNEIVTDLNDDGRPDVVFLLTQNSGGSGEFFYVVAALNTERGYVGSEAFLLGDRIAPQTTELSQNPIHKHVIVVNYADRAPGEPMTTQPSHGKSVWLKLDPVIMQFGTVVQNFEGETDMSRIIQVTNPLPNQKVTSPLEVTGKAVGNWYFEASFPVVLVDWDGKIIAQGVATAQSDWMTTKFVPFKATLTFNTANISGQYSNKGTLILKKDNPSGLTEHDNALEIPVLLK
jgi:hypothetical protein